MSNPRPDLSTAPATASPVARNPRILLAGSHQPTLLRCLDGWPRRGGKPSAFLIQFTDDATALIGFATDRFDLAVVQAPNAEQREDVLGHITRIARQGLIKLA
jgi:hypothetical protein